MIKQILWGLKVKESLKAELKKRSKWHVSEEERLRIIADIVAKAPK